MVLRVREKGTPHSLRARLVEGVWIVKFTQFLPPLNQYFTLPPHSMWNPCGMKIFHGIYMDSKWNMFIPYVISTWIPYGFQVDSMFIPWNDSIWNPCPFYVESMAIPCGIHGHSMWNGDLKEEFKDRKRIY
jgi:hypothetical protein